MSDDKLSFVFFENSFVFTKIGGHTTKMVRMSPTFFWWLLRYIHSPEHYPSWKNMKFRTGYGNGDITMSVRILTRIKYVLMSMRVSHSHSNSWVMAFENKAEYNRNKSKNMNSVCRNT